MIAWEEPRDPIPPDHGETGELASFPIEPRCPFCDRVVDRFWDAAGLWRCPRHGWLPDDEVRS